MITMQYWIAGSLAILGVAGFTTLLLRKKINQATYCFTLLITIFCAIWIGYSERTKEFTLRLGEMRMVLTEVRETQRDVQMREEKIRKLAALMGDFVTFIEGTSVTSGLKASDEWLQIKLDNLNTLSGEKIDNPFTRLTERISKRKTTNESELKQIWEDYEKDVEAEVRKMKQK